MDNNESASQYIDNVVECLQSVENPGDFACGGSIFLPLPALRVHGVDELVGLPISTSQAKAIIEQCSQAPYGRGEETIVDTAVRNTWQLNPSKFTILNPEWEQRLDALLSQVKEELGCASTASVTYQLYKLLLYEKGGFFKVCAQYCSVLLHVHFMLQAVSNATNDCVPISKAKIGVSIVLLYV